MIITEGLNETLKQAKNEHFEKKVVEKLVKAVSEGKKECAVPIEWVSYDFLDQLQDEGIDYSHSDENVVLKYVG